MTPARRVDDRSGFSAVELLAVLVLVGVLLSLAQPAMGLYISRQKTRQALNAVVADIALARSVAVRTGASTEFRFSTATSYRIVQPGSGRVVKSVSLAPTYGGVRLTAPTADGRLAFDARGLALERGNGRVVATLEAVADTVEIAPTGRAYRAH